MGDIGSPPAWTSLDGDHWRCRPFLGDEWQTARLREEARPGRDGWLLASVPGSVVADLLRANEVPYPYRDRNSRFAEWAAERWWAYQTDFDAPPVEEGARVELVLEGIDYAGRIHFDGELLGEHEGMFVPGRFEIGDRLAGGGRHHVLAVLLRPAPREEPQTGDTARVRTHKARMSYGWDFCPRLVHQGIWQSVGLRQTGPVRIERPFVRAELAPDHASARLDCSLDLDALASGTADVRLVVSLDGQPVARSRRRAAVGPGRTALRLEVMLDRPALWWPNGHGQQPLYEAELSVEVEGSLSDRSRLPVGVRSLYLEPNDGAPVGARPYTLAVNGRRIYINGWNWVPLDILYGVPRPAKLHHLLGLARDAHVNLLRVWGGGLIESEAFYSACDRLGILVWQEFVQSSSGAHNEPSADPEFVAMMTRQAEEIVPLRRNHPSLALWCGGNELTRDGCALDESAPVLGALRGVVANLDPDRPFLPTSPSGPIASFVAVPTGEPGYDVHGPWEHQGLDRHQQLYNERASLLHSEFGVEGMANVATIDATISEGSRWPPTRDNAVYAHRGAWWINEPLVQAIFGGGIDDLPSLVRASQLLQADGLRYAVESSLRRRWLSSGTLPWQFNEPFPNAWCTSAVDYFGRPKPAYHAVAAAYEPLHVSAAFDRHAWAGADRFVASVWATSSLSRAVPARLVARCLAADGAEAGRLEADVDCPALAGVALGELLVPLAALETDIFLLDLDLRATDGTCLSQNRYLFSRTVDFAPLRQLPPVGLDAARVEKGPDRWKLTLHNTGHCLAPAVRIEDARPVDVTGWAVPAADHVTLLPGEARTVGVRFTDVPRAERRLLISGWNIQERVVA